MEKIKNDQLKNVIDKICFYDFDNSICNRDVIHIQLSNEKNDIIYSNITFEKERKIFEDKKRKIILLVDNIIKEMKDEKCIIIKYNDKWICNKKITKKLYRELKKNNIKNKETKAIMINLYEEKYYIWCDMYINILDIIRCMDLEGKVYFDVNRYELVYDELDNKSKYLDLLVIPTVSENVIMDLYSEKKSKEKGYGVFRNKKLDIEDFYKIINKNNLKEEWLEFKYEYLKIKAIEWCEYNNIKYTDKKKYTDKN